jgi:hypothetical protein
MHSQGDGGRPPRTDRIGAPESVAVTALTARQRGGRRVP